MTMIGRCLAASIAALAFSAAAALAHDTWLLPARFAVTPGSTVTLDLTSAVRFPEAETAVAANRLAATGARLGARTRPLDVKGPSATALALSATLPSPGVAALWAESRPRTLSLKAAQVEEYLGEIAAPESVRSRWKRTGHWRESYRKMAKTFVRVGEPGVERSWEEPVGMALEVVPDQDPTALRTGDILSVRVLHEGKALRGFSLVAVAEGQAKPAMRTTDDEGPARFPLDQPGAWLFKGTLLEPSTAADTDWESVFTTLTVSVNPAR